MVNMSLISPADIREESIVVTFGNGASDEYPLAPIRVKFDGEEYCVKAAIVHDLVEEVLLGRDVPLHKHMVKRLPRREQMDLLRQSEVQLKEKPEDKDFPLGIEFPFDEELFEKQGKLRVRFTRAEKRRHNQQ